MADGGRWASGVRACRHTQQQQHQWRTVSRQQQSQGVLRAGGACGRTVGEVCSTVVDGGGRSRRLGRASATAVQPSHHTPSLRLATSRRMRAQVFAHGGVAVVARGRLEV